jgi:hypothetical protein
VIEAVQNFISASVLPQTLAWLWFLAPIWAPLISFEFAWHMWVKYVRHAWVSSRKFVLLEIKLPQETVKSPAAMELVLNALIQTGGEGTPHERYWHGKARPWASLEITAIKGEVHFYIWCFDNQKNLLMSNIYAQYPDVAVHEVEDYTKAVSQNRDKYDVWACQYSFVKPDSYPIKTYIDYGLSDDPDEEFKVDPLASLIEVIGSVTPEDQIWIQFIARAHTAEKTVFNGKHPDRWVEGAQEEIQKIIDSASTERVEVTESGKIVKTMTPVTAKMTTEKKDLIDALSRSVTKYPLDVGVRCIQVYPKGESGHIRREVVMGAFRQFGSHNLNNIKPSSQDFDYWWQDPAHFFKPLRKIMMPRNARLSEHLFRCYCLRSYFFYPYAHHVHVPFLPLSSDQYKPPMVMNTEELATLFHFPGSTARSPALNRIPSKRADAPSNLPI